MSLKDFLDANPLPVLAGVVTASGGAVAAVMGYFGGQSKARAEEAANLAAAKAAQAHAAEIDALKAQLRESESQYRLIERKVGEDVAVIDLTRLTLGSFDMLKLDPSYKPLDGGRFRLRTPPGTGWVHNVISEAQLQADAFGSVPDKLKPYFASSPQMTTQMVHLWRGGAARRASMTDVLDGPPTTVEWSLYPQVVAQFMSMAQFDAAITPPAGGDAQPAANAAAAGRLQAMLRGRIGLAYLMSQLQGAFALSAMFQNLDIAFDTIRQVGNVIYVRVRFDFASPGLSLLREWIVVTVRDGLYLLRIDIPVDDSGTDANAWTSAWLSGLKLPSGD